MNKKNELKDEEILGQFVYEMIVLLIGVEFSFAHSLHPKSHNYIQHLLIASSSDP